MTMTAPRGAAWIVTPNLQDSCESLAWKYSVQCPECSKALEPFLTSIQKDTSTTRMRVGTREKDFTATQSVKIVIEVVEVEPSRRSISLLSRMEVVMGVTLLRLCLEYLQMPNILEQCKDVILSFMLTKWYLSLRP
ncbi:hypothetical protein EGR_03543 [Echinococcus granulosus]|uniref:Uncharacterized protein n=1 Tax=Echinococcus granulosus TaxID=6210 RepID=W6V5D9_ECHGR|nr:hypothetical protein EGR_03543 [Echinococcus granulosus]EUB61479.1 hypothetical protein EGR_03543 [Echinococcus granulosus]